MQPPAPLPRTESRNPRSSGLDTRTTLDILQTLNDADAEVAAAVRPTLPALARLVDLAVDALDRGGKVVYFGAGTSGRLAVLDAAELVPTFALEPGRVEARIAGGPRAVRDAVEGAEDSEAEGARDAADVTADDVAVGIAASGGTPYVRGALVAARRAGAVTGLVTSAPDAPLAALADVVVAPDTGPEVLAGSTRLKAGTAAKLVLNGFSTALMVRRGRVYDNLMVALVATNEKLRRRSARILTALTGLDDAAAAEALRSADGDLKTALVATLTGCDPAEARARLLSTDQHVRAALVPAAPTPHPHPADATTRRA
ncbi:N-acetylmuramic acid 6-phosphate etherase [Cellulosimicrobium marinum]|uniref:N-acetylmuramic acid 6-phosphate etherase n=1 Tax=Cellulosimicrobium marinum TaxID=1638992 RepID=UPI001E2A5248|nr:N-acetylmuramic acid 6-phosphate etherase [Cellulosimicrobium marinum]MCB7137128.1 N-acetylmuramic acid 6-phosphate etherase [Cellulosimicrobium marinum]